MYFSMLNSSWSLPPSILKMRRLLCTEQLVSAQVMDPAYQLGPELLAAQKLPGSPVAGMAFGGEGGPDPSKFDIMVGDDFGVWQNKTMESSSEVPVEQSGIPGCVASL